MLTDGEGEIAVRFSRAISESAVLTGSYKAPDIKLPPVFEKKAGAFVTVQTFPARELRGCIGIPEPIYTLRQAILNSAVDAVLSDPRFEPVSESELPSLIFELTVLSPPEPIVSKTRWDLPSSVDIGKHGLIIERGRFRGLLLPQVAVEEKWSSEEFLSMTCWKAGLPEDAWHDTRVSVYRFEGEVFSEEAPKGRVARRELNRHA